MKKKKEGRKNRNEERKQEIEMKKERKQESEMKK